MFERSLLLISLASVAAVGYACSAGVASLSDIDAGFGDAGVIDAQGTEGAAPAVTDAAFVNAGIVNAMAPDSAPLPPALDPAQASFAVNRAGSVAMSGSEVWLVVEGSQRTLFGATTPLSTDGYGAVSASISGMFANKLTDFTWSYPATSDDRMVAPGIGEHAANMFSGFFGWVATTGVAPMTGNTYDDKYLFSAATGTLHTARFRGSNRFVGSRYDWLLTADSPRAPGETMTPLYCGGTGTYSYLQNGVEGGGCVPPGLGDVRIRWSEQQHRGDRARPSDDRLRGGDG